MQGPELDWAPGFCISWAAPRPRPAPLHDQVQLTLPLEPSPPEVVEGTDGAEQGWTSERKECLRVIRGLGQSAPPLPPVPHLWVQKPKSIQRAPPPSGFEVPDLRGRTVASRNCSASGPQSLQMEGTPALHPHLGAMSARDTVTAGAPTPPRQPGLLPSRLQAQMVLHLLNLERRAEAPCLLLPRRPAPAQDTPHSPPHSAGHPLPPYLLPSPGSERHTRRSAWEGRDSLPLPPSSCQPRRKEGREQAGLGSLSCMLALGGSKGQPALRSSTHSGNTKRTWQR